MKDFLDGLPKHKTIVTSEPPTVEHLARFAFGLCIGALAEIEVPLRLEHIRLYETPNSWADVGSND